MNDNLKKFVQGELERITVKISTSTGFKGAGFFVTTDGYILTAWHCIKEAIVSGSDNVFIECYNGEKIVGKLKREKTLMDFDIAVIKTKHQINNCIPLGCVPDNPKTDDVIGIGYPGTHENQAGIGDYSGKITRFVDYDVEIEGAIQGAGQSGGLVYHWNTQRIIGVMKKIYSNKENPNKDKLLQNAGLAAKVEDLLSIWDELSDIHDEIAKAWDERLTPFTAKTDASSTILSEPKIEVNPNVKAKKIDQVFTIGSVNDVKELKIG